MRMTELSFYWHDYETFGRFPRRDRPAQFAGFRTDAELIEIGAPLMTYCRPAPDYLPDPEACLLTGILPQTCLELGQPEPAFAAAIEHELALPGTVGVGYNSIRFDDEVTRFLFWRNLIDPYAREWQNECGRWDLLDVVRCLYALRPEHIEWPKHDDGRVSFKLEHLTQANGLAHEAAHDALSDVRATIALARLIRPKQPKLWDFCLKLRKKDAVWAEIGLAERLMEAMRQPFVVGGTELMTSASIGITFSALGYTSSEDVLRDADTAMYKAKGAGKARYALFDASLHTEVADRLRLEGDLRRAIDEGRLKVAYQPVHELSDGRLAGFEALVRWQHPVDGTISPGAFLPIAEEAGLMLRVTDFVMHCACRQLRRWQLSDPALADITMAINLSAHDLAHPALAARVTVPDDASSALASMRSTAMSRSGKTPTSDAP